MAMSSNVHYLFSVRNMFSQIS